MINIWKKSEFWKAYALTIVQVILVIVLFFIAYLLIVISMAGFNPFLDIISQIQTTGDVMPFADEFLENESLFINFITSLIAVVISFTILISGVLSLFDYLIINQLIKKPFNLKEWIFNWFNYSSMALLLLIVLSALLYNLNNMLLLMILQLISILIFCYLIVLMQFKKNLLYSIRKTIIPTLILLLFYVLLFLIALLLIGFLKWFGFLIGALLFLLLLLLSKIYLMKKL